MNTIYKYRAGGYILSILVSIMQLWQFLILQLGTIYYRIC